MDQKKAGCAGCMVVFGILHLVLGIVGITEQGRFDPFYTPVKCTNLYLDIPIPHILHVVPIMTGATMTDGTYTMHVMGDPVTGLKDAGNQNTGSTGNAAPTQAEYDAAPYVPVPTKCENKNELAVDMLSSSTGKVWAPNMASATDWSTYVDIGDTTIVGDTEVPLQGSATVNLGMKLRVLDPVAKILFAALGVAQPGVTGVCTQHCVVPLFFTLNPLRTLAKVTLLGIKDEKVDLLPNKFCAQYSKFRVDGDGNQFLTTAGPTYCRDTPGDIISKMFHADTQAEAAIGTAAPTSALQANSIIDQFNPTDETLDKNKSEVSFMTTFTIVYGFLTWIGLWAGAVFMVFKAMEQGKPQPEASAEAVESAA